jgi:hypothetical protein
MSKAIHSAFAAAVGLSLACSGMPTNKTSGADPMNSAITADHLTHMSPATRPFTQPDLDRWDLGGTWVWHVGLTDQELRFTLEGNELVATGKYGTFRGGETGGVLVLQETPDGQGPPTTTWVNLTRTGPDTLVGGVMASGGMDELSPVTVRRMSSTSQ